MKDWTTVLNLCFIESARVFKHHVKSVKYSDNKVSYTEARNLALYIFQELRPDITCDILCTRYTIPRRKFNSISRKVHRKMYQDMSYIDKYLEIVKNIKS